MAIVSGAPSSAGAQFPTQSIPRVTFADPVSLPERIARSPVAVTGTLIVFAGAVTQLVALVWTTWWAASRSGREVSLGFVDFAPRATRGFAYMYFSWGAWLVLGLTLGLGVVSCVRWRGAHAFRMVAVPFAVAAAMAPIAALLVFAYQSHSDLFQVVRDYGVGPYLAVLGTTATAFGAAAGSAR
jgi:hypothetical protein